MSKELIEEARRAEGNPGGYDLLGIVVRLADALEAASRRAQKAESALNRVHGYVESACESVSCGKR